jgi:hypothetical protein
MKIIKISSPTFYHGTDSEPFDEFDRSKAKKKELHYNPLGDAMYVTDREDFARMFGKNVYKVEVPEDAKIKRVNPSKAASAIRDILKRALKKVGIDYDGTRLKFKMDFALYSGMAEISPYGAIMECLAIVGTEYPDLASAYADAVSEIATKKFSKYDVVQFVGTNNPNDIFTGSTPTQEILIFNKAFQKVFKI